MKQISYYSVIAIVLASALAVFLASTWASQTALGSVTEGNDYIATSTAPNNVYGAQTAQTSLLKTGSGSLGQVVITGANTGILNFYNATTSNINLRTGNVATSSILLLSIPASAAAGDFIVDARFSTGLIYDLYGGIMPTTTILFR